MSYITPFVSTIGYRVRNAAATQYISNLRSKENEEIHYSCVYSCVCGGPHAWTESAGCKGNAKIGYVYSLEEDVPTVILSQAIKTPTGKGLFIDVSLECGLVTDTLVQSKNGNKSTAEAEASVMVWVTVDGYYADPGHVTFCKRTQELTATFSGLLSACVDPLTGVIDPLCVEILDPEDVGLLLNTMTANSFNFYYGLELSGVHTVEVWAQIGTATSVTGLEPGASFANAEALIGKGSVAIDLVRLIKDEDIIELP